MASTSMHVEVSGGIDGSYPGSSDGVDQQLINYVSFRQSTHVNYHVDGDDIQLSEQKLSKSAHHVQHELPTDVLRSRNDYRSALELATREWTGYGTPESRDTALERWSSLTTAPNVSRCVKAQAYSCLAAGWFERAVEDPERWNIDSLHRAGSNANEAIALGITGTVSLKLGFSIQSHGLRRPEDNRFPGLSTDRFERLADLWEAIDARTAEMERVAAKKEVKAPLKYACSADDCGVQATKRSGLFRCAGKCPVVFKPSYCSKECQKVDWKRHKPFCKADATKSSVPSLNASNDEDTTQRTFRSENVSSDKPEGRATGNSADVPIKHGSTTRANSKMQSRR